MAETMKSAKLLEGTLLGVPATVSIEPNATGGRQVTFTVNGVDVNRETFIVLTKFASAIAEQEIAKRLVMLAPDHCPICQPSDG